MNEASRAPGARLRIERERRGLSLQKAADEMRLDAWVVEALEADQYDRIGPAVYAKGHLKKYAALLAVPWEEVVAAYESLHANSADSPAPAPAVRIHQAPPLVTNLPAGQVVAAAAFLLIVAGVLWWKPWQQRATVAAPVAVSSTQAPSQVSRGSQVAPVDLGASGDQMRPAGRAAGDLAVASPATAGLRNAESAAPATKAVVAPIAPMVPVAAVARDDRRAVPAALLGAGHAQLRLSFSADSWVEVHDAGGRRLFSGYGRANSVKVLAGDAPLRIYLGYASGVQLEINEHAVAIGGPFVHGDVARFQAGADGVLRAYSSGAQAPGAQAAGAQPRG